VRGEHKAGLAGSGQVSVSGVKKAGESHVPHSLPSRDFSNCLERCPESQAWPDMATPLSIPCLPCTLPCSPRGSHTGSQPIAAPGPLHLLRWPPGSVIPWYRAMGTIDVHRAGHTVPCTGTRNRERGKKRKRGSGCPPRGSLRPICPAWALQWGHLLWGPVHLQPCKIPHLTERTRRGEER
jgi:hypothetical protein